MTNTEWVSSIEETAHLLAQPFLKENKANFSLSVEYLIESKTIQKGKEDISKGKLIFNNGVGRIVFENGTAYSLFHMNDNVFSMITNQGIYHLTIETKEDKILNGKAIRYQSQLLESPKNLPPFFSFTSE